MKFIMKKDMPIDSIIVTQSHSMSRNPDVKELVLQKFLLKYAVNSDWFFLSMLFYLPFSIFSRNQSRSAVFFPSALRSIAPAIFSAETL